VRAVSATTLVVATLGVAGVTNALAASTGSVVSSANGKCLDVTAGSTANGNLPQMWSCSSGPHQTWTHGDDKSLKAWANAWTSRAAPPPTAPPCTCGTASDGPPVIRRAVTLVVSACCIACVPTGSRSAR
jgi:hypothetical protein